MNIKEVGINRCLIKLNLSRAEKRDSIYYPVKYILNDFTDTESGKIALEDAVFLPEGTFVLIKDKQWGDKLGKIFHCEDGYINDRVAKKHLVVVVPVDYDENSIRDLKKSVELQHYQICKKMEGGMSIDLRPEEKYLQVVDIGVKSEEDKWRHVKIVIYTGGNCLVGEGWEYWNGELYKKKDLKSEKVKILSGWSVHVSDFDESSFNRKILDLDPAPGERTLLIFYIIIMFGLIIFKDRVVGWIGVTLLFLWIRADLRRK